MKVSIGPYPKNGKTKRKISIKIDPYDTWSMDSTLAMIVVPMLKQLKATMHGIPGEFVGEYTTNEKLANKRYKEGEKKWNATLDKMILAFERIADRSWEHKFYSGKADYKFVPMKDKPEFSEIKHGPKHTFKVDDKGLEKAWIEVDEGLALFAKYYRNLWD